jgi:plastocyanin
VPFGRVARGLVKEGFMRRRSGLVLIAIAATAAACGGGGSNAASSPSAPTSGPTTPAATTPSPTGSASPACSPAGTQLKINTLPPALAFNTKCLAAPADTAFTIEFDNRSPGVPHDVAIATEGLIDVLFKGKVLTGPEDVTYRVKAIPAGTYVFYCTVHPTAMNGTLVVG